MKTVTVNASRKYDVLIRGGLLSCAGEMLLRVHSPCKVMLVTDSAVGGIYGERVKKSLISSGFCVSEFVIEDGEKSKSTDCLVELWEALASEHFSRTDVVAALGGGVVGDLAGFAAATYLRGIEYVQLPTTLLAMVDSSVGGKTAIDLSAGKNLAGAFYQPSLVLCDPQTLSTLKPETFSDGMAEVIKYGMMDHPELLETLMGEADITEVIELCVKDKRDKVCADELDKGVRRLLNLGHTMAHGIELCSGYTVTHGRAVAAGMMIITRAAVKADECDSEALNVLSALLKKYSLPLSADFTARELCEAAMKDKKRSGDTITLVVPYATGKSRLKELQVSELYPYISRAWDEL